jgi:hypothetical protein
MGQGRSKLLEAEDDGGLEVTGRCAEEAGPTAGVKELAGPFRNSKCEAESSAPPRGVLKGLMCARCCSNVKMSP